MKDLGLILVILVVAAGGIFFIAQAIALAS